MKTLLLDQSRWDLCLDAGGNLAVATEPYAVAQDVASAIRLFLGELWYDTTKGVPYFGQILGKFPPAPFLRQQFIRAALTVPGVTSAQCSLSSIRDRTLSGQVLISYLGSGATTGIKFVGSPNGITAAVTP